MRKGILAAFTVALPLSLGAAVPAHAGDYGDRYARSYDRYYGDHYDHRGDYRRRHILTPGQIVWRLRQSGYTSIHDVRYLPIRGLYRAMARDWRGRWVDLSISPHSGRVIRRNYVYAYNWPHRGRYDWGT